MRKFENWGEVLTFATSYDGVAFEKMEGSYGMIFGVMEEDIVIENTLTKIITETMTNIFGSDGDGDYEPQMSLDELMNFNGRAVSKDSSYKTWAEWAKDEGDGVRRDFVKIKGAKNIKSKVLKISALAKAYLDPKVFDYKSDNTYLYWN